MKPIRFWHTIQFKLFLIIGGVFLCISLIVFYFHFHSYQNELIDTLSQTAENLNKSIESSLEMAMLTGNREQIQTAISRIGDDKHIRGLFISDKKGVIRAASDKNSIGKRLDISDLSCQMCHRAAPSERAPSIIYNDPSGARILRTVSPIYNHSACYSCHSPEEKINGVLFLDYSLASYDEHRASFNLQSMLFGGALLLIIAGSTFFLLNKLVTRRITRLVRQILSMGSEKVHSAVKDSGRDEFAILSTSINQMSQRVRDSILELRKQRDNLQKIIDSVQDGLIVVGENFEIVLANEAFHNFIGKADGLIGIPCYKALGKDVCGHIRHRGKCPSATVFAKGEFNQAMHVFHDETDEKILEISASPLKDETGQVIQSIEIIRDVTEKKLLENDLLQSEKMASVGRLAAGIAHEINNPLATISICTEGLLSRSSVQERQGDTEYLERIEKCVYKCKTIIERLLAYSHSPNAKKEIFSLNNIIAETLSIITPQADKEGKRITTALSSPDVLIKGHPTQIGQLILNLTINGLDAVKRGGTVGISTVQQKGRVFLCVEDDGIGVDRKDHNKIFDPFYTTKEIGKGTGLGLYISRQIVAAHRGKINVKSAIGRGTKFEVILPTAT